MSFPLTFLVLFSPKFVFGERCSEALHDAFRKGLPSGDGCDGCEVLVPSGLFPGGDWAGFCVKNRFFLFEGWKCREGSGLEEVGPFAVVTEGSCERCERSRDLDVECMRRFNAEMCDRKSEVGGAANGVEGRGGGGKEFLNVVDEENNLEIDEIATAFLTHESSTSGLLLKRAGSTRSTSERSTTSTTATTEKSTTETSTRKTTRETSTQKSTSSTSTEKTTEDTPAETVPTETTTEDTPAETVPTETTTEDTPVETMPTETTTEDTPVETVPTETTTEDTPVETMPTETTTEDTPVETMPTETTPTKTSSTEATTQTVTSSSSATIISSSGLSSSPKSTPPPENIISSTKTLFPPLRKTCEPNEFFYKDYCYFIKRYEETHKNPDRGEGEPAIDSVRSCRDRHPKALGVAVETKEENDHVLGFLKTIHSYDKNIVFTSGFQKNGFGEWIGWNRMIDHSVLDFGGGSRSNNSFGYYCINPCESFWYLLSPDALKAKNATFLVFCERPYNPKKIQPKLHERCLEMYRDSSCYSLEKFRNFCCAKDERGELWFACPNKTEVKNYSNEFECKWKCGEDGFFSKDRPTCAGKVACSATYNQVRYVAPLERYAIGGCPRPSSGYSSWYCGSNRTFLTTPDYSLCCELERSRCKDTDAFLNVWMGCPSRRTTKRTACPAGAPKSEALVWWYCQDNGKFLGSAPDYSNCYKSDLMCVKKDRYERKWTGLPGTVAKKECPPSFTGECSWKCKISGSFEGSEPDCSKCKARWMDEIAEKIKNHSQHEEIMEIMENYTEQEDIRIGFSHVINLTAECVTLYKSQTTGNKFGVFDKFLKSYSKILKNLAGNSNIWSSFSETDREEYVDRILQTTQTAAFANLEMRTGTKEQYNATFTTSGVEGFDFFVAYNPPAGTDFPLQNSSQSDWNLRIKKMADSPRGFAAMGLIMNSSLGSLMFPRGNETKELELNAPAVTFTVAAAADGEVAVDPNVVVVVSFKHANRTRFPATEVIRRKLHAGEHPSGVFNSTLCFYYRDSDWSTEGCSVTYTSTDRTNCTCNHLSTIGLLMSIHKYHPDLVLEFASAISSGITIVSLVLALLVFHFVDKGNNDRVLIGKNLCFCLLLGHVMLFSVMDKKFFNTSDTLCKVYAILLHYVFMAAFAWMFVEGCHLYRMLVLVFNSDVDYRWIYLLIGYGVPFVVVGATELVGFVFQEQPYGQDELCWLKPPNYIWAFIGPVTVITSVNFCILIVSMKLAISSKRRTEKSNFGTLKLWVKGWISLSTLLGVTWLFGLGYICYNETFAYAFVVFNGLQGFFIFLFRCILCEQYKAAFLKKLKSWFSNSKTRAFKKSENVKSETKLYAISGSKSLSGETETKDSGFETISESGKRPPKKSLEGSAGTKRKGHRPRDNSAGIGIDINVTLTPEMSEAYLRNRMIAKNFSARKSKATWLADSENFPELSYHGVSNRN